MILLYKQSFGVVVVLLKHNITAVFLQRKCGESDKNDETAPARRALDVGVSSKSKGSHPGGDRFRKHPWQQQ